MVPPVAPGPDSKVHDWCLIRLGLPGVIRGIVVDTAWFRGNYPASCAIHATEIDDPLDLRALEIGRNFQKDWGARPTCLGDRAQQRVEGALVLMSIHLPRE